jgi:hypothetical protein
MRNVSIFLLSLLMFVMPARAQTWVDSYSYTTPSCSPFVVNSSMNINIPLTISHEGLSIFVPGSPNFANSFPLQKTYRFDIYRTDYNWLTEFVGSIRKSTLNLSMPLDFQALLPSMTPGYYDIYVYMEIDWPYQTPYTINYQSLYNGSQQYYKANLQAPGNSSFSYYGWKVACFEYVNCFSGSLSSFVKFGQHRVTANTSGGSGNFTYQWIVEVNKFNPGESNCSRGQVVYSATTSSNQIIIPCTGCNLLVYCIVTDNVTGCRFQYTRSLSGCSSVVLVPLKPAGGGADEAQQNNIRILPQPGRQVLIDGLPSGGNKKATVYSLNGILLQQAGIGTQTQTRLHLSAIKDPGNYVVAVEQNGKILARKMIRVE